MASSNIKVEFSYDIKKVWDIVTSLENYLWRSDLSKIEVSEDGKTFVEYTKDGYETTFHITCCEQYKRWEFDIENGNMSGHWIGVFTYKDGITTIDFTENVTAKKIIMKPLVGLFLRKQQKKYVEDLKAALEIK